MVDKTGLDVLVTGMTLSIFGLAVRDTIQEGPTRRYYTETSLFREHPGHMCCTV
jgi:hypothetical protein